MQRLGRETAAAQSPGGDGTTGEQSRPQWWPASGARTPHFACEKWLSGIAGAAVTCSVRYTLVASRRVMISLYTLGQPRNEIISGGYSGRGGGVRSPLGPGQDPFFLV